MIQFDEFDDHIFQVGWNHQLEILCKQSKNNIRQINSFGGFGKKCINGEVCILRRWFQGFVFFTPIFGVMISTTN